MTTDKRYEVTVTVETEFIPDQSDLAKNRYAFAYHVKIINTGNVPAQLISRHWIITDANNHVQEVKGLGVVGAQPLLKPNQQYEYTSGTLLATPIGSMRGTYQIVAEDGTMFDAIIESFTLAVPKMLN